MDTTNVQDAKPISQYWKYIIGIGAMTGCLLLLVLCSIVGVIVFYFSFVAIYSEGSLELATEWRDEMASWEVPSDATKDHFLSIYEFADGEWAIVKSRNSHSGVFGGGGTVVVKDSNGMVNIFHKGHVCGDGNPSLASEDCNNLEAFYDELARSDFSEFTIP